MPTPRKHIDHAARQRAYVERQRAAHLAIVAAKTIPARASVPTMPSTARWRALSEQAQAILQTLLDEMELYRDERSEQWQEGERAEAFQDEIEHVAEALECARNIHL